MNEVYFIHLPMKMEPIVSSETSAIKSQTPGNYPKRNKLDLFLNSKFKNDIRTQRCVYITLWRDLTSAVVILYRLQTGITRNRD